MTQDLVIMLMHPLVRPRPLRVVVVEEEENSLVPGRITEQVAIVLLVAAVIEPVILRDSMLHLDLEFLLPCPPVEAGGFKTEHKARSKHQGSEAGMKWKWTWMMMRMTSQVERENLVLGEILQDQVIREVAEVVVVVAVVVVIECCRLRIEIGALQNAISGNILTIGTRTVKDRCHRLRLRRRPPVADRKTSRDRAMITSLGATPMCFVWVGQKCGPRGVHDVVCLCVFSLPLDEFGAISGLGFVVAYFLLPLVNMWSGFLLELDGPSRVPRVRSFFSLNVHCDFCDKILFFFFLVVYIY